MKLPLLFLMAFACVMHAATPRVSIITSVFNGDAYIKAFLENIVQQTIFDECELLMINAASPGNEEEIIHEYQSRYPNIKYIKLEKDPGIYGVWNIGAKIAQAQYLTNANLDDLRNPECLEKQAEYLDQNPEVGLVYGSFWVCYEQCKGWHDTPTAFYVEASPYYKGAMKHCLPGPQPMWRKSVHEKCGYFDESYLYSGDWEFWNRMAYFDILFGTLDPDFRTGIYYHNPVGLSTNQDTIKKARRDDENNRIVALYQSIWN